MQHPNRYATLSSMINLRRLPVFQPGAEVPNAYRNAEAAKAETAEQRILEITELAFVLETDGFAKPEIFRRIAHVHPPAPEIQRLLDSGNPLRGFLVEHLRVHAPNYVRLGPAALNSALALAELWAVLDAERRRDQRWPPPEMLDPPGPLCYLVLKAGDEDVNDIVSNGAGAIEILDALVKRGPLPTCPEFRRMRARAVPGDELRNYNTGAQSFEFMMGSAGIALVRSGRAIDYVELLKN